jgi:hypothetical protein
MWLVLVFVAVGIAIAKNTSRGNAIVKTVDTSEQASLQGLVLLNKVRRWSAANSHKRYIVVSNFADSSYEITYQTNDFEDGKNEVVELTKYPSSKYKGAGFLLMDTTQL